MSDHNSPMTAERAARNPSGRLVPWADPATGVPGWQVTTQSRHLAAAVAATVPGATACPGGKGEWRALLPEPALPVVAIGTDPGALWFRLAAGPSLGVFALPLESWPAAIVLECPLAEFPAGGRLSVRDVRRTTRMGRVVRFLIPVFTPDGAAPAAGGAR